jgi:Lrp/AsnC family leucine-responsive transcriptional regulator
MRSYMADSTNLDSIDKAILRAMQSNCRVTNHDLSTDVGASESSCIRRVKQLEKTGVIERYSAIVNQSAIGFPLTVFVTISLNSQAQNSLAAFEKAVLMVPEVQECHLMTGSADYLLRMAVRDVEDLARLHSVKLTKLPGVARVNSSLALRRITKSTMLPI